MRVDCGAGLQQSLAPGCRTIEAKKMAALALASSEADDVFEAVASHLRRPPFSKKLAAQDLRDGRDLKTLLYEVCADIDAARACLLYTSPSPRD